MKVFKLVVCLISVVLVVFAQDETVLKEKWCGQANCYELLDVSPDSERTDIKSRYNNLSLELHPDKNPNQTQEDKDRYTQINLAYEILSDTKKRRDYDRYLAIKSSLDSPKENILFVTFILFGIAVVAVHLYQNQRYKNVKTAILERHEVKRFCAENYKIDLSNKKSKVSNKRNKGKRKKNGKNSSSITEASIEQYSIFSRMLRATDPTTNDICNLVNDDQINEIIKHFNLNCPEWNSETPKPTWKNAIETIPTVLLSVGSNLLFHLRWQIRFKLLGQKLTLQDREYLCRTKFKVSQLEWDNLTQEEKEKKYMSKPGKWRVKRKKTKKND